MNLEAARAELLGHARSKKNGQFPLAANLEVKLSNPICGDHVHLKGTIEDGRVLNIGFKASACAICTASASLICEAVPGLNVSDVIALTRRFESAVLEGPTAEWPLDLARLACFKHLRENPSRRACALLAHVALRSALLNHETVIKPTPETLQGTSKLSPQHLHL